MENEGYIRTDAEWKKSVEKQLRECVLGDSPRMTVKERDLVAEYARSHKSDSKMTYSRYNKTASTLIRCREYFGDYTKMTKYTLEDGLEKMEMKRNPDRSRHFTQNTLHDYFGFVKRFATWLIKHRHMETNLTIEDVDVKSAGGWGKRNITEEELIYPDEIEKMIQACDNSRDRAYISLAYEAALRMVDIANIKWQDIQFPQEKNGQLKASAYWKTDKIRTVPCYSCTSYLAAWRADYPRDYAEPKGNAFVFVTMGNTGHGPVTYNGMRKVLYGVLKASGIGKEMTSHTFRHSRITEWLRGGKFSDLSICMMAFGNKDTRQLGVYAHLYDRDIENGMAEHYGMPSPQKDRRLSKMNLCKVCSSPNPGSAKFCNECGNPMTADANARMIDLNKILEAVKPEIEMEMNRILEEKRIKLDDLDVA
ncbi:MAG: site-specific integrase [Methanomicrobiales archaeon]